MNKRRRSDAFGPGDSSKDETEDKIEDGGPRQAADKTEDTDSGETKAAFDSEHVAQSAAVIMEDEPKQKAAKRQRLSEVQQLGSGAGSPAALPAKRDRSVTLPVPASIARTWLTCVRFLLMPHVISAFCVLQSDRSRSRDKRSRETRDGKSDGLGKVASAAAKRQKSAPAADSKTAEWVVQCDPETGTRIRAFTTKKEAAIAVTPQGCKPFPQNIIREGRLLYHGYKFELQVLTDQEAASLTGS